uniref:2-(3-amino-3-carboxypropyl)histidine synthase subunit 2 n=1 Tax=Macrostomum lignano TaxID=282301 RepID=A0A1I8GFD6_9PLAT
QSAITGDDSKVLANVLDIQPEVIPDAEFATYFDLSGTVEFIRNLLLAKAKPQAAEKQQPPITVVVGLQLPSPLFHYAKQLVNELTCLLKAAADEDEQVKLAGSVQLRLLADTDSCCVDCVTAAHCGCSAVIHYGDACFSRCPHLPVHYVLGCYGNQSAAGRAVSEKLAETILSTVLAGPDCPGKLLLVAPGALHASVLLAARDCLVAKQPSIDVYLATPNPLAGEADRIEGAARFLCGRWVPEPFFNNSDENPTSRVVVHFTTDADSLLGLAVALAFLDIGPVYQCVCQPGDSAIKLDRIDTDRRFKRRMLLSSKAAEARRIGLLVCGCVDSLTPTLDYALGLVRSAGRVPYIVSVGRINPAKLANYADIDAFALIGCYLRALLDSRDYFQPLLSMVELERALNPNRQFAYAYSVDFSDCLPGGRDFVEPPSPAAGPAGDGDGESGAEGQQLVLRNGNLQVALPAGNFLSGRSWRGLDPQLGATPVAQLEKGRSGLAIRYDSEDADNAK